ncbi:leader peptidase (prepilin peptidase) / N-methyltransferase [Peptoniphilus asaccharolyticus DSM 20463]|uniref:Leader peptidase (Prepilin peptidase) / N-methyltransferase n=1 Tax=Peptoniphilus asaccharolyticus DSM 20463 TaxID=573058 RepID=A0A1W1UTF8_PEPAS|nr:A24 family peptidase [Peptoniphilus asaccharolyticus]MBL7575167.1 prepilin peptidase [Peptoniphilus asaccharolyticus]SMB84387.1 leader peptidase (prepilin peptidase) / N-methyltransferase [Peptoniphilus asaccharolyticus DSM 20463]
MIEVFIFILGAVVGSTLACLNYRRRDIKSFIYGKSKCEKCNANIKPMENIPIISFLFLRGRCSNCNSKIDITNFLYEIATPICFLLAYHKYGLNYKFYISVIQIIFMMSIALNDLRTQEVYYLDIIILLIFSLVNLFVGDSLIRIVNAVLIGSIYFIFYKLDMMGDADFMVGAIGGLYSNSYFKCFVMFRNTFVLALVYIVLMKLIYKKRDEHKMAFCPFIVMGILTVML